MIRSLFPILGFLLLFVSSAPAQNSQKSVHHPPEVIIERTFMEGCETGRAACPPVNIYRSFHRDSLRLVLPCGGTQTDVVLVRRETDGDRQVAKLAITAAECPPIFDLTGLPDGEYGVGMVSCGLGGGFTFYLETMTE